MPKRKFLHNFVRHINSHVFRAWSVERGAWSVKRRAWSVECGVWSWSVERDGGGDTIAAYGERSVEEAATESPHTEKGARGDAKEQ